MKKTLAVAAALAAICTSVLAAPPPGNFNSHRVHVSGSPGMHTPIHNRVRMTPSHGHTGPVGGRMSSMPHPGNPAYHAPGSRSARIYVRPSLPPHHYSRPLPPPPPRRRYRGYYSYYPYGYSPVWWAGSPIYYGIPYGTWYNAYYTRPGVRISVRL